MLMLKGHNQVMQVSAGNMENPVEFSDSNPGRSGSRSQNKLWDEITRYFNVDLTVRKLVMNRLGQLLRNFRRKLRQTYILPNQDTPSKLNEVPAKYSAILKAKDWVNFVNYMATEEYKVKSAKAKMACSKCVFPHTMGRGGYAHVKEKMNLKKKKLNKRRTHPVDPPVLKGRGWEWSDIQEDILIFQRIKQAADEEFCTRKSLDARRERERGKKELLIKRGQLQSTPTQLTPLDVSPVEIHPINSSADEEGGTTVLGCHQNDASIRKEMQKREIIVMSADSAVTYTSVHSEARSWSIPSEDPYEEAARQLLEQAPHSLEYIPDPMELEDHVPVYIPEPEHPEDLVPAEDEAPTPPLPPFFLSPHHIILSFETKSRAVRMSI
ncbi:hypothetical protein Tco_0597004 [Tanacetum coccineum]